MALAGSIILTSVPTEAYAGTPVYDPVFYYYHPDNLGSSQFMTDRDGDMVQQYGYRPFGSENYHANTQAFSVSNRYTGQTLDEETGLYYYGARYYDPELARFIQADSTVPDPEFSQAYNRYAYCYNNPLKFSDPTGQNPFLIAVIIGAYMGGLQGALEGGFSGMLRGAFLGAATAVLSASVGMVAGQLASGVIGAVGGTIAGSVAGFAASYALRGATSGNWQFTAMDAVNLVIAIWAACLEDPTPGRETTVAHEHAVRVEASQGESQAGGTTSDDLGSQLTTEHLEKGNFVDATGDGQVGDGYQPMTIDASDLTEAWLGTPADPTDLSTGTDISVPSRWIDWQLEREYAILYREASTGWEQKLPTGGSQTRSVRFSVPTEWPLDPWINPGPGVSKIVPGLTECRCVWQRNLVAGDRVLSTETITTKGYLRSYGHVTERGQIVPWKCDARYGYPGYMSRPSELRPSR